jgi:hypothetical protein
MSDSFNPYAAAPISSASTEAEQVREFHLSHEASVKSIAVLYILGSFFGVLASIGWIVAGLTPARGSAGEMAPILLTLGVVGIVLSIAQFVVAFGIRKLAPWSRISCVLLSAIGLLGFPIGTLISGYIIYLMLCAKGKMVFSPEYKQVIEQTPHMKYKTSIVVWIFLGLLIALFGFGIVAALFAG